MAKRSSAQNFVGQRALIPVVFDNFAKLHAIGMTKKIHKNRLKPPISGNFADGHLPTLNLE